MGDINEFQMECNFRNGFHSTQRVFTEDETIEFQLKTQSYVNKRGKRTPLSRYSVENLQSILKNSELHEKLRSMIVSHINNRLMTTCQICKAKTVSTGEWVTGFIYQLDYVGRKNPLKIMPLYASAEYGYEILPDTLCRSTSVVNNAGELLFENDIVEFEDQGEDGYEYKEGYDFINRATIFFDEDQLEWSLCDFRSDSEIVSEKRHFHWNKVFKAFKLVGNKYDKEDDYVTNK